ncbi:cytochrome c oxidase subunit II [Flavitalea sp. BT771]|uniref:cytochrome c oxidase subunit II n=1 Tax=Flavitalea sp. BT771 TaxID=3063329 RepID=UPI0026E20C76|nr:cytochrome c oxidase subunit II [Flavitalea sp. BT771]MDO6434403.1 cytochrome c oxidase subunit II [Flavitalea sp. BT771]MDV6223303.1 cytochrome c oxidase subunit II [Flavitalea sp. BT771]
MSTLFLLLILLLGFLITFQIAKASEYVGVLKGEKKNFEANNRINGFLMIAFLVLGLIGVYWCNELYRGKILGESASKHGEQIDTMMYITIAITGVVFVITQILLFWFAYKYQYSEKRTAYYFPHDNRLEIIWTVVPAIALTVLVGFGLFYWFRITGEAPADAAQVEVTGKQFGWIFRYPGKDGVFGKKYYKNIDEAAGNSLGLIWDDPSGHDDVVVGNEMYIEVLKPIKLIINSRDVVHDVGLVHFRQKMDAVPGTPTTMWFTPKFTTDEMKKKLGNPDFEYELSCDQMCGKGHFTMRAVVKVVTHDELILWKAKQKAAYVLAFPDKDPSAQPKIDTLPKNPSTAGIN